jgi:hypothetical protein
MRSRRTVLAGTAAAVGGLAGCLGDDGTTGGFPPDERLELVAPDPVTVTLQLSGGGMESVERTVEAPTSDGTLADAFPANGERRVEIRADGSRRWEETIASDEQYVLRVESDGTVGIASYVEA